MSTKKLLEEVLVQPRSVEDLNIPQNILIDIVLRLLYTEETWISAGYRK